ncbi:MAG: Nif3-like dinuclear metal center hexameric protein [Candidatus Thermoplasmatota archaeon]|nr:Nif3-like dinuclear metal center hexameric protein [Candidatus Thermoplasmatota archaeon]MBS3789532.1 Nif3-like dinuclear metal center hexameric protein [Candidatus Thermoplasmatota archaeon]
MISDSDLIEFLDDFLNIDDIKDESENGVQIDAPTEMEKIAFAVDVRKDIVKRAIDAKVNLLFVHHGLIWNDGLGPLIDKDYEIVRDLIKNNTGLYGAHLPLDVHSEVGNNVELAKTIGAEPQESFMEYKDTKIARMAVLEEERKVEEIARNLEEKLDTETYTLKDEKKVKKIGILTGKGGQALKAAKENGADLFITGERTYMAYNEALDLNMPLIFAGHYATEILGVKKMMKEIESEFGYETCFLSAQTTI